MYFEQFYLGCLAHASYLLGSNGVGVIVDPQRDVDIYVKAAAEQNLRIEHIFETHLHADFVSGHRELAERTGAKIYIGEKAGAKFPHVAVKDGTTVPFGESLIRVLETPGHTPESVCLVVHQKNAEPHPWAVLTGDTLFIGDVGRPDLSDTHTPQQLAVLMYDSLHRKLLSLPDDVLVYPAHGAGSLCGRSMSNARFSTIGAERLANHALQIASQEEFVVDLTANLPPRPAYFAQDAAINREGAPAMTELPPIVALSTAEVKLAQANGAMVLDVRPAAQFAVAHVPGAINIGFGGQLASWAGIVLGLSANVVIVAESAEQAEETRTRLARVGIEHTVGYLRDGMTAWQRAGEQVQSIPQIAAKDLRGRLAEFKVLDVRRESEWQGGHIEGATWHALDNFPRELPSVDKDAPLAVHCKGGYRSMIAASLLQRAGFTKVTDVTGGYDAWVESQAAVAKN
jgi:glyoxylase-like metal-dependent hydrolase (beta-lactamase superfamily II)/rhodanese-related sulfurtransferase